MARTGRHMTAAQKKAWAEQFDHRKKSGAKVRKVGGMTMVQADNGWFQRNGDACPGKGYDAQADGDNPEYDRPPRWSGKPSGRRLITWGGR
ncbi:MAG: hypothetical protein ACRDQH_04675 [Pseudonocardiaceae bacterium]